MSEPVRGPNRPMASGRRPASSRSGRPSGNGSETNLERVQPRIPWTRRIGIVIAVLALSGTVVVAGGLGNSQKPGPAGSPSQPAASVAPTQGATAAIGPLPRKAPVLAAPSSPVTASRTWTARVTLTATGIARANLKLRIYRNDHAVMDVAVKRGATMSVPNIPLKSGANLITAVFVSPGGEGPRSNVVTVTLDTTAPQLDVTQPENHAVLDAASVTVTGQTEAAAKILVTNLAQTDAATDTAAATADADGQFSVTIALVDGANDLDVTATDAVGNVGHSQLAITRGKGGASAVLMLSNAVFHVRQLPTTFDVTLTVTDATGQPADGALVTFSLSPPGVPTSTYQATSQAGVARWPGVTLAAGIQSGSGFVTARVSLPGGPTFQESKGFVVH